jgi:hypothetical protein
MTDAMRLRDKSVTSHRMASTVLSILALLSLFGCGGTSAKPQARALVLPARLGDALPSDTSLAFRANLAQLRQTQSYGPIKAMIQDGLQDRSQANAAAIGEILDNSNEFVAGVSYDKSSRSSVVILVRGTHQAGSLKALAGLFAEPMQVEYLAKDVWVVASEARIVGLRRQLDELDERVVPLKLLRQKYGFDQAMLCLVAQGSPEIQERVQKNFLSRSRSIWQDGPLVEVFSHFQRMGLRMDIDGPARLHIGFHVASSELAQAAATQGTGLMTRYKGNFLIAALGLRPVFDNAFVFADDGRLVINLELPERDVTTIVARLADLSKLSRAR